MSVIKDGVTVISPGQTLMGTHNSVLINNDLVGKPVLIANDLQSISDSDPRLTTKPLGRRTEAIIMRNTTGSKLTGGMLVKEDISAGFDKLGQASALGGASGIGLYVVDPLLGADGVAENDLFLAHVRGPSKVLMNSTGILLAANDQMVGGASGYPAKASTPGAGTIMGTFLYVGSAASNKDTKVPVLLHPDWA